MKKYLLPLLLLSSLVLAEAKIELGLESRDVQIGQSFIYRIIISDAKDIKQIEFPKSDVFKCIDITPHTENSRSISVINGKVTQTVINNTTYMIRLVPQRIGEHKIPSLQIEVDGKTYRTQPVLVNVSAAEEITDIALELSANKAKCYVGQPVVLTWKWYIGRDVGGYKFDLPILVDDAFTLPVYKQTPPADGRAYPIHNTANIEIIGELHNTQWRGYNTKCLEFKYPIIPKKAGFYRLEAGNLICEIQDKRPQRSRRTRSFFDFDDFFDRQATRTVSIQGNTLNLDVQELPSEGKADNFSGIIGKCNVSASATPCDVNVGDPIVLTITVSGAPYPDAIRLPQMLTQKELAANFRISDEDSGNIKDGTKQFQCTIRAQNDRVTSIPSIVIPYFDDETGKYSTLETQPIPIKVHAVKTITALDVVGSTNTLDAPEAGKQIKVLNDGIAHNYAPDQMRGSKCAGFTSWTLKDARTIYVLALLLIYVILAIITYIVRKRNSSPEALAAKAELAQAIATINNKASTAQEIASAIHTYFRAKLHLPTGAETYEDLEPSLRKHGYNNEQLDKIKTLLSTCEAIQYSGNAALPDDLRNSMKELIKK